MFEYWRLWLLNWWAHDLGLGICFATTHPRHCWCGTWPHRFMAAVVFQWPWSPSGKVGGMRISGIDHQLPATSWCLTGRQYTFVFIAVMVEDHFALLGRYLLKDRVITVITVITNVITWSMPIILRLACFDLHSPMSCNEVGPSRHTWCSNHQRRICASFP